MCAVPHKRKALCAILSGTVCVCVRLTRPYNFPVASFFLRFGAPPAQGEKVLLRYLC